MGYIETLEFRGREHRWRLTRSFDHNIIGEVYRVGAKVTVSRRRDRFAPAREEAPTGSLAWCVEALDHLTVVMWR